MHGFFRADVLLSYKVPPYIHGEPTQAVATLVFDNALMMNAMSVKPVKTSYELLSEEDLEEQFKI